MPFIRINNRKNFLLDDVPDLHPSSAGYLTFWREQKKRVIEGFWGVDDDRVNLDISITHIEDIEGQNKWRWMPPQLYFYVNLTQIEMEDENSVASAPILTRPTLRDTEWEIFYNWIEARGFSGFEGDDDYTCLREVLDVELGHKTISDLAAKKYESAFKTPDKLKSYIPARDYLRKLHDRNLGKPLYQNKAKDLMLLGSRGIGKSYSVGNGVILHELITDGKKRYDKEPRRVEIFVGAGIASKSTDLLEKVENAMNSLKGAWAYNTDNEIPSPLKKSMSGTLLPNNKRGWRAVYEKKVAGEMKEVGSRSTIKHGIYTVENPEAAAGTRPTVMIIEEVGLLEPVLKVHASNEACQTRNGNKFGSSFYIGTGGNVDKIQESEIIFRDPEAYGFLGFNDEWEGSSKPIGFFIPAYYANNEFKDHNGNTDVDRAIAFYEKRRDEKKGARSSNALDMEMMNYPIKPSEMFLNSNKNMFPVADLKEQLSEIKTKPHKYEDLTWFGELVTGSEGKIVWKNKEASGLLREWPIKDNKNKPGLIQIFEMPKLDGEGKTMGNRYIVGTDTYDDDESSTLSLGSAFVIDTFFDRIVAEFTGRPETTEFYEITRRLTLFYNAENNYEQNKKGLFWHYEKKNSVHLLAETPKSLSDTSDVKILKVGNRKYGTTATVAVNAYALRLINSWLVSPDPTAEEDSGRLNLHNIKSIGLLNELISYNPNGNFDRISALGMALILKEDKYQLYDHSPKETVKVKDLAQDAFFTSRFNKNALPNSNDGWLDTMNGFMELSHTNRRNNFPRY